ncbi:MAG: tetratricopeptide repeat protein [Myxococcaceae bacterium]|nr:tetratricopeptide repeat protein [Myxococcaceae bacterium]
MPWLIAGVVVIGLAFVFGRKTDGSVRVPTDGAEVLEKVASSSASGRELKGLELAARDDAQSVAKATAAARKAIELARAEADPRYWGRAQAALQPWWGVADAPPEVVLLRATIRQALHDFDGARADLQRLGGDPQAVLTLATVELVTGRYAEAKAACERLQADALVVAVCGAQADSLTGKAVEARAMLEAALGSMPQHPQAAWALSVLGEVRERSGDDGAAEAAYREALKLDPNDGYTLTALADLLLDLNRGAEVEPLLSSRFSDDNALLRLAVAEVRKNGKPGAYAQMLRWRYQASAERGDTVHQREQARFQLEVERDAAKALELATKNWAVQKEPADARVLLDAALAAGRPEAAREAAKHVLSSHMQEPRLLQRAKKVPAG